MGNYSRLLVLILPVVLIAGCINLGPDYERPNIPMPKSYYGIQAVNESIADLEWWQLFEDPKLQLLITEALRENRDLRQAIARVNEVRARYYNVRADQFPALDGSVGAGRGNMAEQVLPNGGIEDQYTASLRARYEVDLWGRYRRATESARAELLGTEDNQRAVLITLIADVASTYLLLRDLDARVLISEETLDARKDTTLIIQARYDHGTVPLLDVNQAQIEEADAMSRLATFRRQRQQAENALSVLLGSSPRKIMRGRSLKGQIYPIEVPAGLPSVLLERRPDIRAAEQNLAAQTARIGVAKALRFPSIALTANGGYISDDLGDLIESDSKLWDIKLDILGPIFDAGKRKAQVEVEIARTEQALYEYEQTILLALQEVEDSLAGIKYYREELNARSFQLRAAKSASILSRARYDGGITDYLEVLDSDRSLFDAQLAQSAVERQELVSIVSLYKALGGGWLPSEPEKIDQGEGEADQTQAATTTHSVTGQLQ
ncbi:MAG: efflux transporter outer membrane subunit [Gammaproteobacteria bacterium]|nr:efflux transporter outer membrane subunit [Gammaproteobacteria bacterium]MCP4091713.1 efflux transporter outer membrane subunit [Gammaproteobacteria bacterium]MCP4275020.1 efflux transporter outer membrane subunit [Gammaproteobacteria bacterium]MCP4831843.1 efflux transporter outer membrane subunit [Gammaproteobacteria bacterium]MCP4929779.1 efflux transporter outer membrane subunit [Gammaproteobacteria bacterium]